MGLFDNVIGGLFGGGGDSSHQASLDAYNGISLPLLKEINPELYQQVVSMNPELETAVTLGPSATEGIALDPKYRQAQLSALQKLMDISSSDGQDAQFLAGSSRLQNDVNSNLKGNSDAIQQNMAMRGMSGGMSEMVNKQISSQGAANRQAQMGLDLHAQAQQRALQALMSQGNMADQMSNSDFSQQNTKAQAQDAISRFNAQNLQNVNSANTAARNSAQQYNANSSQNIANQNTQVRNAAQQAANDMVQQNYNNQLNLAGAKSGAFTNYGNSQDKKRDNDMGFVGGLIGAGAQAFGKKS